jgi:hypothetical protein
LRYTGRGLAELRALGGIVRTEAVIVHLEAEAMMPCDESPAGRAPGGTTAGAIPFRQKPHGFVPLSELFPAPRPRAGTHR